jgi:hypothetical protein
MMQKLKVLPVMVLLTLLAAACTGQSAVTCPVGLPSRMSKQVTRPQQPMFAGKAAWMVL